MVPPAAPIGKVEAFRFLNQATFGATDATHWQVTSSQTLSGRVQVDSAGKVAGLYMAGSNDSTGGGGGPGGNGFGGGGGECAGCLNATFSGDGHDDR